VVNATPQQLYSQERDLVLIVLEAGWAPGLAWMGAENLAPLGFDPRTVQPIASRYTDRAIPAPANTKKVNLLKNRLSSFKLIAHSIAQ
jgi:hypothetical protein